MLSDHDVQQAVLAELARAPSVMAAYPGVAMAWGAPGAAILINDITIT